MPGQNTTPRSPHCIIVSSSFDEHHQFRVPMSHSVNSRFLQSLDTVDYTSNDTSGPNSVTDASGTIHVRIPNDVASISLAIEYLSNHVSRPPSTIISPLVSDILRDSVSDTMDVDMLSGVDAMVVLDTYNVANYLGIDGLSELCAAHVASIIRRLPAGDMYRLCDSVHTKSRVEKIL
jgi:hypothetical protein